MSRVVCLGDGRRLAGYATAGVEVVAAETAEEVRAAVLALGEDVALVIVTPDAEPAARPGLERRARSVWCSLPR